MKKLHFPGSGGYTFIELLLAITILGFVITPFLVLFSFSFHSIALAGQQTGAINLCREKMESLKALRYDAVYNYYIVEGNNPEDDYLPGDRDFRRNTEVSSITLDISESPPLSIDLLEIKITVYWTVRDQTYSEVLESYLARY